MSPKNLWASLSQVFETDEVDLREDILTNHDRLRCRLPRKTPAD